MKRKEALADAIAASNGSTDPGSRFYKLRNPGQLKAFIPRHIRDERGFRIFDSHIDGYRALLHDLDVKCNGKSTFGVGPQTPLHQALPLFGVEASENVVSFLQKVFDFEIDEHISLAFFAE